MLNVQTIIEEPEKKKKGRKTSYFFSFQVPSHDCPTSHPPTLSLPFSLVRWFAESSRVEDERNRLVTVASET